ncbi:MAG: DUF6340 family protein [Bacteroidales bacterium]
MKNTASFMLIYLLFAILTSCTAPVYFEKTVPPEISFTGEKATASLINTFNFESIQNEKEKFREAYDFAAMELIRSLKENFQEEAPFRLLEADTLLSGQTPYYPGANLPPEIVQSYCRENRTPTLLVLSSLLIWFTGENADEEEEPKLLAIRSQNVFLHLQAEFLLFNSSGFQMNHQLIAKNIFYKSRSSLTSDIWLFTPGLKKAGSSITALAEGISKEYYDRFYPQVVTDSKTVFAGTGFGKMRKYTRQRNWDAAIYELIPLAASDDPKVAGRAAYNLSVMYEITGDMAKHEFWLNKSGGVKPQESIKFSY